MSIFHYSVGRSGSTVVSQVLRRLFGPGNLCFSHDPVINHEGPMVVSIRDFRDAVVSLWRVMTHMTDEALNNGRKATREDLGEYLELVKTRVNTGLNVIVERGDYMLVKYVDMILCHTETSSPGIVFCHYNFHALFNLIEDYFGRGVSEVRRNAIETEFSMETNKKRAAKLPNFRKWDEKMVHGNHIYTGEPGVWKKMVAEADHEWLTAALKDELDRWGY